MAYDYPIVTLNKDDTFGPTLMGHKYKSVFYHNKTAAVKKGKNKWILKMNQQYEVFRIADEGIWFCNINNGLFSILDSGKEVLGMRDERLAYFVRPNNELDPWHGYPILSSEDEISEELLDFWEENKIITPQIRIKIGKGQL